MVSGRCLKGVWRVIESFLDQLEIQSKFNLLSTLTFTWNSSVALLSPTCYNYYIHKNVHMLITVIIALMAIIWLLRQL